MEPKVKEAIEMYQCPGCVNGTDTLCYVGRNTSDVACRNHVSGTFGSCIGKIYLGLPKGFCRIGECPTKISIFEGYNDAQSSWSYNKFNIPVWKYLDSHGNTIVRGLCPRVNYPFIHIFLEDCRKKIDCLEITDKDIEGMD